MTRNVTAVAMLAMLIGAAAPALAASTAPGAARPPVTVRPPVVRPSVQPRVYIPSIGTHVGTQLQNNGQLAKKKKGGKNTTKNQEQYLQIEMKDAIITNY